MQQRSRQRLPGRAPVLISALALILALVPLLPAATRLAAAPAVRPAFTPAGTPADWVPGRVLVKTRAAGALAVQAGQARTTALGAALGTTLGRFHLTRGRELLAGSRLYALEGAPGHD
jgi:hypothetical protein